MMTTQQKVDQFDNPLSRESTVAMQPINSGYGYDAMNQQTVQMNPQVTPVYTEQFKWCDFVMSFITFILGGCCCVNPVVMVSSIMGMVYSSNAYVHHGDAKYGSARNSNSIAKIFWILSLVLIIITFIILIICIAVLVSAVDNAVTEAQNFGN